MDRTGNSHTWVLPLTATPPQAQMWSSWSKLQETQTGWDGPPSLRGLNKIQATDHTHFPGTAEPHDRWCSFDFNFKWKKSLKITPWSQGVWDPLLSAAMRSTLLYPSRKASFLMTDASVGLVWTVPRHSATLACEEAGGWSFPSDWGRLNTAALRTN